MSRRLLAVALGAAAGAALLASHRRSSSTDADRGRERTERLRREIEDARSRLRDDLARARGE